MKGLILAGGAGTRLRPITHSCAKQLVPVANKPILFYGLEDMAAAGIRDVAIVVGDTADEIRSAVGDGSRFDINVTYIPQDAPLGLAHCVVIAHDFLADDDFATIVAAVEEGRVVPLAISGASILSSTVRAAGSVIVPRECEGMAEGEEVEVLLYDEA